MDQKKCELSRTPVVQQLVRFCDEKKRSLLRFVSTIMCILRTSALCVLFMLLRCKYGSCGSVRTSRNDTPAAKGKFSVTDDVLEDMLQQSNRSAEDHLWPEVDGVVSLPYVITAELCNRTNDICKAFNMISQKTCISFHERTTEPDYLNFVKGHGCASFVGRVGGPQPVFIGPTCHAGNICHELLHVLGLYHEHTRPDRDRYVNILYKNIKKGKEIDFLVTNASTQNLPYDLESIMHYGKRYFSANGQPTIVAKTKDVNIGQRRHLSDLDVQRIQKLYNCGQKQIGLSRGLKNCEQIQRSK
ncbi:zinc metalloproteinase nas-4-like [Arapaima gigas]